MTPDERIALALERIATAQERIADALGEVRQFLEELSYEDGSVFARRFLRVRSYGGE